MKWQYEFLPLGESTELKEDVKLLNREGLEEWELVSMSFKPCVAIFKRPVKEPPNFDPTPPITTQEEVRPMNTLQKLEGNRTVIALGLFALMAVAQLFGITPDSVTPEKQGLIKEILGAVAGIFLALKGNRLISKVRG